MRWLVCAVILAGAFGQRRVAEGERVAVRAEDAAKGRELYNRNCTMCHGLDGSAGDRAPALGATRRYLRRTEEELFDAIKNGIPGTLMPPTALDPKEVRLIVAYIRSLRATAADSPVPGDVEKGSQVFFGKGGCAGCHTIDGRGGILGPELSNIGAERRIEALRDALTKRRETIPRGYVPVKVTLRKGPIIEGIVKNEHNSSLQILSKDGRMHSVNREEASAIEYSKESLMPVDWDRKLSAAEFQDLLAFLSKRSRRGR